MGSSFERASLYWGNSSWSFGMGDPESHGASEFSVRRVRYVVLNWEERRGQKQLS